jgi:hypothetical protein
MDGLRHRRDHPHPAGWLFSRKLRLNFPHNRDSVFSSLGATGCAGLNHHCFAARVVGEFRNPPEFLRLIGLIPSWACACFHAFSACDGYHHPARRTRWTPVRCCRVCLDATSGPDSESGSETWLPTLAVRQQSRCVHFRSGRKCGKSSGFCVTGSH